MEANDLCFENAQNRAILDARMAALESRKSSGDQIATSKLDRINAIAAEFYSTETNRIESLQKAQMSLTRRLKILGVNYVRFGSSGVRNRDVDLNKAAAPATPAHSSHG